MKRLFFIFLLLKVLAAQNLQQLIIPDAYDSKRQSSSNKDLHKNGDAVSIAVGETITLGELQGPGIITHIWATVGSEDPFYGRSLVIRIYWDGAEKPSVQVPFGDFFAMGHGMNVDVNSLPVSTSSFGRAVNCFWKMPFRKSARITITNESEDYKTDSFYYYLDWRKQPDLHNNTDYFHAEYRQQMPAEPGDYTILETKGKGRYVGTVYSVQQVETGWFGEGDDRFYIDGESKPSLRGTGTEDYFGDAWGFRRFNRPYYGVSLWEGYFPGDRATAYRWHIEDPVSFDKSLKVTIEHKGSVFTDRGQHLGQFIERPDWISSVAYWYQQPQKNIQNDLPPLKRRIAPYIILKSEDMDIRVKPETQFKKTARGLEYMPMTPQAEIEIGFSVAEEGRYQINAFLTHSVFGSLYQPYLDGKPLGDVLDLCSSGQDRLWTRFDLHDLKAGKHKLVFIGKGASPHKRTMAPPLFYFGLDYIVLLRLEDMDGYHSILKKRSGHNKPRED